MVSACESSGWHALTESANAANRTNIKVGPYMNFIMYDLDRFGFVIGFNLLNLFYDFTSSTH